MAVVEENPLVQGLERLPVHPTTLVIFGGTGDLAQRKLLPAGFNLISVSRSEMSDDDYRKMARESIQEHSRRPPDEQVLEKLLEHVRYVSGTFDVDDVFERLKDELGKFDEEAGISFNRIFYLSTAPNFFALIVKKLGDHGLHKHPESEVRVVIEKPFCTRLEEALELNRDVLSVLDESQVFRIDHYLGKETVQNMLAFRFANGMFEPIWNRNYIDNVQITAAEGKEVPGYREEEGVPEDSRTETYAALRMEVDNWRWEGVPIYLRTGKRLARKVTEIAVTLKPVPHLAFQAEGSVGVQPNQLVLTMQPNEGVSLTLAAKIPGTRMKLRPVHMDFLYGTAFLSQSPEAYERLIMDAMRGDATLFTRDDEVEAQWRIFDPILESWNASDDEVPQYEAGTDGPAEADALMADGHRWRAI